MPRLLTQYLLACFVVLVAPALCYSTLRYVSTSGSNANNGTSTSTPKLTIDAGIASMSSGDTLYLCAGACDGSGSATFDEALDQNVRAIPSGGSWASATSIRSYPGEIITLRHEVGDGRLVNMPSGSYIIFESLIFDGALAGATIDIGSAGAHHLRFSNVEAKDARGFVGGSGMAGPNAYVSGVGHEFLQCNFHHSNHSYAFYIGTGSGVIVDHCAMHDNAGFGFQLYDGGTGGTNHTVSNSRIYGNGFSKGEDAANVGSGGGHLIYNNLIYNNNGGVDSRPEADSNLFYNNTFWNNGYGIRLRGPNAELKNTIFYQTGTMIVVTGSGAVQLNNLTSGDPLFINASAGDFHIQSGSPAINAGLDLSASIPATDADGFVRGVGGAWDRGAYEFGGAGLAATHLRWSVQPSATVAGQTIAPMQVEALDSTEAVVLGFASVVTVSLVTNPGSSTLSGDPTQTAVNGVATFGDLSLNNVGTGYTLQACAVGLPCLTSTAFTITAVSVSLVSSEWGARGLSRVICSQFGLSVNTSGTNPGVNFAHTLTCDLPSRSLSTGSRVKACALVELHTGASAGALQLRLASGSTLLVSNAGTSPPAGNTLSGNWVCFALVATAPPGTAVPVWASFENHYVEGIQFDTDVNVLATPVTLNTQPVLPLGMVTQWDTAGSGDASATVLAFVVEMQR